MTVGFHVGIDPGLGGAVAALVSQEHIYIKALPKKRHTNCLDGLEIYHILQDFQELGSFQCWIEQVESRRFVSRQATQTTFRNYGVILGILDVLSIPYTEVVSHVWKPKLHVTKDKGTCLHLVSTLFPGADIRSNHNRAEAVLMAEYGRRLSTPPPAACET